MFYLWRNINTFVCKLKIKRGIKKFLRILSCVAAGGVLLLGVAYVLLRLPRVQTVLVGYVTERLEAETGVKVSVGGVDFRPMRSLVLNDVLVRDFKEDTLVYCRDVYVRADSFSLSNRRWRVREVELDGACFHLWMARGDEEAPTNVERFLDSLSRGRRAEAGAADGAAGGSPGWLAGLRRVKVVNSTFTYREEEQDTVEYGVNWTDVECRQLGVELSEFDFSGDVVRMRVDGLGCVEKSGLVLKEMEGLVEVDDGRLVVRDCRFGMAESRVELMKLEFRWTPGQHDWRYFTRRVKQVYELGPSAVSFHDLAYFNEVLRGIDNTVLCSGVVKGTVSRLEGRDLYFELGDRTVFEGRFSSRGLPRVRDAFFSIELEKAHFGTEDLAGIYLPWFGMNIPVPSPLRRLPYLDFERVGFEGTMDDFVVEARSVTPSLSGDFDFRYMPCGEEEDGCSALEGAFRFGAVDFGRLAGVPAVGGGELAGRYAGTWDDAGAEVRVNMEVPRVSVGKGSLRGVTAALAYEEGCADLLAYWENGESDGAVAVRYESGDSLEFMGVRGEVEVRSLGAFGYGLKGGAEGAGASFDWVAAERGERSFGNLSIGNARYYQEGDTVALGRISVENNRFGRRSRTTLQSEVADVSVQGNYLEVRPKEFLAHLVKNYLPIYSSNTSWWHVEGELKDYDFEYVVDVKDANRVLRVLVPELRVSPGSRMVARCSKEEERFLLTVTADTVDYGDVRLVGSRLEAEGDLERMEAEYVAGQVVYGNGYRIYNLRDAVVLSDNRLDNDVSWCNWEERTFSGNLSACVEFSAEEEEYTTRLLVRPGVIVMDDSVWHVEGSTMTIRGKELEVDGFAIRRGTESFTVQGRVSEDASERLEVNLRGFNLGNVSRIALSRQPEFFGMATGSLTIQDYYHDFLLLADFTVEKWGVRRDTLGTLYMRSYWDTENRSLMIGAENRVERGVPLVMRGFYDPDDDRLEVSVKLEEMALDKLEMYAADYVSDVRGCLSGSVNVKGTLREPDISGFVYLDSVGMKVNALNTDFSMHDSVHVMNNRLLFKGFGVRDAQGHPAVVNGWYDVWRNLYDMDVQFRNFRVLNTQAADNDDFYGQMYLSGLAELRNEKGIDNVTINARTERDSRLFVPLTAGVGDQSNNFLHFLGGERGGERRSEMRFSSTDVNLNANLEVNENLEVQVIFDPTVGDVLKTTGAGNIKVDFDKDGHLAMFGEYRIMKGDYLFTLSNLVNKKFVLTPGGTISWSGSPYEAMLDIRAVYNLKTTITELLPTEKVPVDDPEGGEKGSSDAGRKVPVECVLNLSDNLSNPAVRFGINFPSLDMQTKSYIQSLFSSQDEVNKQMFSLLILNHFYQSDNFTDYENQAQTAGVTTVTEMMSNQLSRWLSQINNNVDVGLVYRVRDPERGVDADELELALSTQFLNDRITISANGNMDLGGTKTSATGEDSKKTNIAGDFDMEVKLNKQGTLKMRAYSHTDEKLLYNSTETIQGVGVSYQESFDTLRELLRKYFGFLRRRKKQ